MDNLERDEVAESRRTMTSAEFWTAIRNGKALTRCTITEDVNIRQSGIPKDAEGIYSISSPVSITRDCRFESSVDFEKARFEKTVCIENTIFEKNANFANSEFNDTVTFICSEFQKGVTFQKSRFKARTDFYGATFRGDSAWLLATFSEDVSFRSTAFTGEISTDERSERDGVVSFALTRLRYPVDFADIKYWPDTLGQWWVYRFRSVLWKRKNNGNSSGDEPKGRWITRWLRATSRFPSGLPNLGTIFVLDTQSIYEPTNPHFKRHVADQQFVRSIRKSHKVWSRLWRWTCDYGRSWWRWIVVAVSIILICGFFYGQHGIGTDGWNLTPFYMSVVVFTTLGFGDVVPIDTTGRIVVMVEVLSGYIMLGLLLGVLQQRVLRRS